MANAGLSWRLEDPACTVVPKSETEVKEPGSSGRKNVGMGYGHRGAQGWWRATEKTIGVRSFTVGSSRDEIPITGNFKETKLDQDWVRGRC